LRGNGWNENEGCMLGMVGDGRLGRFEEEEFVFFALGM